MEKNVKKLVVAQSRGDMGKSNVPATVLNDLFIKIFTERFLKCLIMLRIFIIRQIFTKVSITRLNCGTQNITELIEYFLRTLQGSIWLKNILCKRCNTKGADFLDMYLI